MVTREVEVECLPADIPEEFKVDVSDMLIGKQLRAGDLPFDRDKVKLLTRSGPRSGSRGHSQEGRRAHSGSGGCCGNCARGTGSYQEGQEGRRGRRRSWCGTRSESREAGEEGQGEVVPLGAALSNERDVRWANLYEIDRRPRQSRCGIRMDAAQFRFSRRGWNSRATRESALAGRNRSLTSVAAK